MKRLLLVALSLMAAGAALAADGEGLASRLFPADYLPLDLFSSRLSGAGQSGPGAVTQSVAGDLNPGKALLLSAILPGAGEYYAGQKTKAAIFFAVEVAAWTGVVLFYNQGMDKDDEFRKFADIHFSDTDYWAEEYRIATTVGGDSAKFVGTQDEWLNWSWERRIYRLPRQGFTHELPSRTDRESNWSVKQQYYEMIGKYVHQFGFGWDDGINDQPGTSWFDGRSPRSEEYMDMRHDSNQLLKMSAWGYNLALLNHVASALDASLSVRVMNREARAQLGFRQVPYDGEMAPAGGVKIIW
jgi:hypothetical protein